MYSFIKSKYVIIYLLLFSNFFCKGREIAQIPFENEDGKIIISLKINDFSRPLRFLFDTGSDGMAVGKELADSIGLKATVQNSVAIVGGNIAVDISRRNQIFMGNFLFKNQDIAIFEGLSQIGIDGIIGNNLTKSYIVNIDYERELIRLLDFEDDTFCKDKYIPFIISKGVFIIKGKINLIEDRFYDGDFVFDTGANLAVSCFRHFVVENKMLVSGFKPNSQGSIRSLAGYIPTFLGKATSLELSKNFIVYDPSISLAAGTGQIERINNDFFIPDGSIGIEFIRNYNFTIDIRNNKIYLARHGIKY